MPFNLSTGELLVLAVVAVIIFGGRLPSVARRIGGAIGEFRRGMSDEMRRIDLPAEPELPAPSWRKPPGEEEESKVEQPRAEEPEP
jgi:TatA/E family protein of Tat protein translocase